MLKKINDKNQLSIPFLYQLFIFGVFCWTIYTILDIIIFSFAAVSFESSIDTVVSGYDVAYPSLFIANILREISILAVFGFIISFYIAHHVIISGEHYARHVIAEKRVKLLIFAQILILCIFENIEVSIKGLKVRIMNQSPLFVFIFSFFTPILLFSVASICILSVSFKNCEKNRFYGDEQRRINLISVGYFILALGFNWFLFWMIIDAFFGILVIEVLFTIVNLTLHAFWVTSAILIYLAFRKKRDIDKKAEVINN